MVTLLLRPLEGVLQLATCCSQQLLLLENVLVKVVALHAEVVPAVLPGQVRPNFVFRSMTHLVQHALDLITASNWTVQKKSETYSYPDKDSVG